LNYFYLFLGDSNKKNTLFEILFFSMMLLKTYESFASPINVLLLDVLFF